VIEEEHLIPPLATKKKTTTFVSMLPKRRTRSTRSAEAAIGWKDVEQAIPILHPMSSMVDTGTVPQEPTVHVETDLQELVLTDTVVTPEPAAPHKIVPLELVILEPTDNVTTTPQEPVLTETDITQEPTVHVKIDPQEPVLMDTAVTQEPTPQHAEDVPLAQLFAQIEKKIKNTENSRIGQDCTNNKEF
jgi:hypothetical protein